VETINTVTTQFAVDASKVLTLETPVAHHSRTSLTRVFIYQAPVPDSPPFVKDHDRLQLLRPFSSSSPPPHSLYLTFPNRRFRRAGRPKRHKGVQIETVTIPQEYISRNETRTRLSFSEQSNYQPPTHSLSSSVHPHELIHPRLSTWPVNHLI
jgi:hypothetical protein